ncbi:DMBT1 [Mytilus coruscus]|uniref:DMBT1 n=1 Tax=Mytilus coruscus TaxID=42192 RepID=A0A6J8ANF4_MYTCO|nr:DMBT1 [Mytilus coruscus]
MRAIFSNVIYLVFFGLFQIDYTIQHTPIQLRGGKNRQQGRVEVYHSGQWGTICDDKFDQNDARVVCRMIGLEVLHPIFWRGTPGTGRIWMDDLECNGEETDLTGCLFSGWSHNNCQHEEDISVNCDVTEVRLTNGTFAGEGRIEVKHDGEWGSICGNSFNVTAATVICQMLGFNNTKPTIHGHGYFGKAHGKVLMDHLVCKGNETDINQCTFPGWGKRNCRHDEDVGISCATPVRLVGGPIPSKGRLEVYHAGKWGTVCNDGFDTKDAIVVCRTLGFLTSHPVVYSNVNFGLSTLNTSMDDLACDGTEHDISACKFRGWGSSSCNHRKDVVVQCQTRVRLVDGPTPSRGRVEVMYRGEWGTICDDSFGQEEATVVCRMLGYHNSNYRLYGSSHYNEGLGKIWMDDLSCDGSESDIINCKYPGWGQTDCSHTEDVSLDCVVVINAGQGTVNVYHESQWGSVCDDKFDVDDAKVICGMIGHHTLSPTVYSQAHFGQRSGPIWLDAVRCSGKESDLGSCSYKGWGKHDCSHSEDAGVDCVATIKDTLTVNCENQQWGAAVNLTSLKYLYKDAIRPDKMIISFQNCTGMIYDDLVLFQQHYDDCGSSKTTNDTYDFVIYRNEIVYLDHGIRKWTAPLECKKQRTTRIAHYHLYPNKRFVLSDVNFFYDWVSRISDKIPYAFKQFYFYEITLLDKDPDLTFTVERCSSNHHKNGKRLFRNLINNARAVSNDVSLTKLSRERTLVGQEGNTFPPIPATINDVAINGRWCLTKDGDQFLSKLDNGWGIAVFCTREALMCLGDCNDIYIDATFKSVPRPYMQFLTIHGFYRDRVIPFVYALMTDKHIGSYRQIMRHIKRRYRRLTNNDLSPQNIVSDFETGMITAAETEFPQARMCGCFFHFCRSIWRRLQKEGLQNAFDRRLALRRCVRKMMAIAYLPLAVVRQNFQLFRQDATTQRLCHNCPGLRELLTYFQRNYLNGQFSPVIWNVYQRNMDNRTNNHVECNFQQEMERSSWQTSSKLVVLFEEVKNRREKGEPCPLQPLDEAIDHPFERGSTAFFKKG